MPEAVQTLQILEAVGAWSLLHIWLPLAAWTLIAWPILYWLDRADRSGSGSAASRMHPHVQVRVRQALLFSLPAGLAAGALLSLPDVAPGLETLPVVFQLPAVAASGASSVSGAAAGSPLISELSIYHVSAAAVLFAAALATIQIGRLLLDTWAVGRMRRKLSGEAVKDLSDDPVVRRMRSEMNIRRRVRIVCVAGPATPLTFGLRRPLIVLPNQLTRDIEQLRMTLAHEMIHIRRHDFAAQWAESLNAALFAIHPLFTYLQRSIQTWRERSCDAAVLEDRRIRPAHYARLLRDLAVRRPMPAAAAIALSEHPNNLKSRLEAMKNTNVEVPRIFRTRFAGFFTVVLVVSISVALAACSDSVSFSGSEPSTPPPPTHASSGANDVQEQQKTPPPPPAYTSADTMPQFEGGNTAGIARLQEALKYPEKARQDGVEGTVVVQFIVEEDGSVARPSVVKSVHPLLDSEALRVTRELQFEPGQQDGKAVKVQMSLPIRFTVPS